MNPHDRHNPAPSDTNKTDSDQQAKSTNEFSTQAQSIALRDDPVLTRQERTEKILELLLKSKQQELKEKLNQITGHHSVSSSYVYIDAAIRDEK